MAFENPNSRNELPVAIVAITRHGVNLALRLHSKIPGSVCHVPARHRFALAMGATGFARVADVIPELWPQCRALVCIMAAGIVVRLIAPLLVHKASDPAVVVVDERGQFAISLVSGHYGGANRLAHEVAALIDARPVITTASDVREKPAVDLIAKEAGLEVENPEMVSRVTRGILEEEPVWIYDPDGRLRPHFEEFEELKPGDAARGGVGIWVSERLRPDHLSCLVLRPRNLVLGVGCNRGTAATEIVGLVESVFLETGLSLGSVRNLVSVDLKADEKGLLEAAETLGRPIYFFSRDEIGPIEVPNPSGVVQAHIGVQSVCEATALLSARSGSLIVPKRKTANATLAVVRVDYPSSASDPATAPS